MSQRMLRVCWPCDRVNDRELRILRKIARCEQFDSPSIGDFRTTDRLERRGLIAPFDPNHRGWYLTQRGRDLEMRQRYAEGGLSCVALGKLYGVSHAQAHRIVTGQRW